MLDIDLKDLNKPCLIHSDIFRTSKYIRHALINRKPDINISFEHFKVISNYLGMQNLIFPCFNYDFPKTRTFDLLKTESQVGKITNFILENRILDRTKTPIFSFLTSIDELIKNTHNHPFSHGSVFDYLYKNDGIILFYGAEINSCTFIHFIESLYGPPLYRYDKFFHGKIIENENVEDTFVCFHVRPLGINLDYNWTFMASTLINDGVIKYSKNCNLVFAVKARELAQSWANLIKKDPLLILDEPSRIVIDQKLQKLGRRFELSDFESQDE